MMNVLVIALVLAGIIILIRLGVYVGISLFIGGLALVLASNPYLVVRALIATALDIKAQYLMVMGLMVASFAELYRTTGFMLSMGRGLMSKLRSPLTSLVIIPAVIGLMPVTGGALMSAPVVEGIGSLVSMEPELMIFANVWFRHTIFLFYPLGTELITTSAMTGFSVAEIALIQVPVATIMILVGAGITWKALRKIPKVVEEQRPEEVSLLRVSAPLIIAIAAAVSLNQLIGVFGMPIGVFIGYITLALLSGTKKTTVLDSAINWRVAGVIFAGYSVIFLQRSMIVSGATDAITSLATSSGISPKIIEVTLPPVLSLAAGSTLTGIVLTVPVVSSMMKLTLVDASIIFVSAYMFYVGSPAHLCLVYTSQYFKRSVTSSYKYMIPAVIITATLSLIYLLSIQSII